MRFDAAYHPETPASRASVNFCQSKKQSAAEFFSAVRLVQSGKIVARPGVPSP